VSMEALLLNGFSLNPHDSEQTITSKIFRIRTTGCMRPYEIVGDCSDKGGHWYQSREPFILRKVSARRYVMFTLPCDDVRCFL